MGRWRARASAGVAADAYVYFSRRCSGVETDVAVISETAAITTFTKRTTLSTAASFVG